jgi:endogenous inhibitor of DNA gyrase (YacG/DUF329 family)
LLQRQSASAQRNIRMSDKPRIVNCPQCGKPVKWTTANPWRPFCSERCKLIDLGTWANEGYRIPASGDESSDEEPPASD